MNILDMIGGALGGAGTGGLDAVMDQLRAGGLNDQIGSWIAQGANQAITPDRVRAILGDSMIANAAQSMGLSPERISEIIAQQLPAVIDMMTPDGNSPGGGFGAILGQVLGGGR